MQTIRNLIARVTTVWTLFNLVSQFNSALKSYPGASDEIRLRAWLLDHLALLAGWATKSATPIDDAVVYYSLRIIENDTAWKILFCMLSIACGQTATRMDSVQPVIGLTTGSPVFGTGEQPDCILALYEIDKALDINELRCCDESVDQEPKVENSLLVISAIGLILQIIQFLRKR